MTVPCSTRIDLNTILSDPVTGPSIKALGSDLTKDPKDEEVVMALYFMHQRVIGSESSIYHSIQAATPPDLAMNWKMDEIDEFQDRETILSILRMRRELDSIFESLYAKLV